LRGWRGGVSPSPSETSAPQRKEARAFRESAWIRETAHPAAKEPLTLIKPTPRKQTKRLPPRGSWHRACSMTEGVYCVGIVVFRFVCGPLCLFFFLNPEKEAKRARGGAISCSRCIAPPLDSPRPHHLDFARSRLPHMGLAGAYRYLTFSLRVGAALPCTASRRGRDYPLF